MFIYLNHFLLELMNDRAN